MENLDAPNPYEGWHNITDEQINSWLSEENLSQRTKRSFQGFEIIDSLDGRVDPKVEISLVRLLKEGQYPQHVHNSSDAYFIVASGTAIFLSGLNKTQMKAGDRMDIPRGTPHGFEIPPGGILEFISLQSPPIKDEHTGEEDFHLIDQV